MNEDYVYLFRKLQTRADEAYFDYLYLFRQNECLGWEEKINKGIFGETELKAHKAGSVALGRHMALQEAATLLHTLLTTNSGGE